MPPAAEASFSTRLLDSGQFLIIENTAWRWRSQIRRERAGAELITPVQGRDAATAPDTGTFIFQRHILSAVRIAWRDPARPVAATREVHIRCQTILISEKCNSRLSNFLILVL
jgi:hypothetical protein